MSARPCGSPTVHPQVVTVAFVRPPQLPSLIPGFPECKDIGIFAEAPWSPAVPQESKMNDLFEDCMPPTG